MSVLTTGTLQAMASRAARPKLSLSLVSTNRSQLASTSSGSGHLAQELDRVAVVHLAAHRLDPLPFRSITDQQQLAGSLSRSRLNIATTSSTRFTARKLDTCTSSVLTIGCIALAQLRIGTAGTVPHR